MDSTSHTGRVAVITGASSGIGAATARALSAAGLRPALLGRRADRIAAPADELGDAAIAVQADVTGRASLLGAARRVRDELGGADVLVNLMSISSVAGRTARAGNAAYAAAPPAPPRRTSPRPSPSPSPGRAACRSTRSSCAPRAGGDDTVRTDHAMGRRGFVRLAATGIAGAAAGVTLTACGADSAPDRPAGPARGSRSGRNARGRVLLAYFSRPGENYWNGGRRDLEVGNTEVLARMIARRLGCDVHRIDAADPYPADYDDTVARNVREQDDDARPAIANRLASIDGYDTILLASPIWNVRAPMIMSTFAERYDFAGRTVHPVTTHAMSGLGTTPDDYARVCRGARIGDGLPVRGEAVRAAGPDVDVWLRRAGLPARR